MQIAGMIIIIFICQNGENMGAAICFAMVAINVPFIVSNPTGAILNWASAVYCFGLGIACAMSARR